ncbi:hypothetical protein SK128_018898, partial [Halocaridina rubra]
MAKGNLCLVILGALALATWAAAVGSEEESRGGTEYSYPVNDDITELPQFKLYSTIQSSFTEKMKNLHSSEGKTSKGNHNADDNIDSKSDTLSNIVLLEEKKPGKRDGVNATDYEMPIRNMPVAEAYKTSGNGYTRSDGTYMVNDDDEEACVMAYFKCQSTVYYPDAKGDYQSKVISPAEDAEVYGMCDRTGEVSEASVKWAKFVLTLRFGLDDLTDSWFVSRFSLTYDLRDAMFPDSASGLSTVTVASKEGRKFWQTNNAYSFRCLLLHDIALADIYNNTATLHFDEVRVQAFCDTNLFRRPKHCIHRVHRDEMVPVTVGGLLAGSTLLTVAFYGIF